jgi:hypothetical protein
VSDRTPILEQIAQALRDHGMATAIGVLITSLVALAAAVVRKAFTNEAMLQRLERELEAQRERQDERRDDDRAADADRLGRIERDIGEIRKMLFEAFRKSPD